MELHSFRCGFLVVALRKSRHSVRPAVSGKRTEITDIRKHRIVPVCRSCITHKQIHHIAPFARPAWLKLFDKSSGMDEVSPMEMMIVQIFVLTVPCRIAEHSRPVLMVIEQERHFAFAISKPVLQPLLDKVERFSELIHVSGKFCNARCLNQTVQQLTVVVAVSPVHKPVVSVHGSNQSVQFVF